MKFKRVSVKGILSIVLILCVMCAILTLTACENKLDAVEIEVVQDTVPDVATVGSFELSQLKLKVKCADGSEQQIAVTLSMLDSASKNSLKEPGEKTINVFYQNRATTFTIFLVEEGTKTVSVTFIAQDGTTLGKKYAIAGGSIEAPIAPSIEGKMFDSWLNRDNSQQVNLSSVANDLVVFASYTENAAKYTVRFYDYNKEIVETYTDVAYNSLITAPAWVKPSAIASYAWNWNFATSKVTQNTSIYMTVEYVERIINFKYVYDTAEGSSQFALDTTTFLRIGSAPTDLSLNAAITEMTNKGKTFVRWINKDAVTNNTSSTLIALVEYRNYTLTFIANGNVTTQTKKSGESFVIPIANQLKTGYSFSGEWKDSQNKIYKANSVITIESDLTLTAQFTPDVKSANFIFNFVVGLPDPEDEEEDFSIPIPRNVYYDDVIKRDFIANLLEEIKRDRSDTAFYDIDTIKYRGDTVSSSGQIIDSSDSHEFIITCVDVSLGSPGLSYILNGTSDGYIVNSYDLTPTQKTTALSVFIPENHKDLPVVAIADGVFSVDTQGVSLSMNISLPEGLLSIGASAFAGVNFLGNITIPASVTSLGASAFASAQSENAVTVTFATGSSLESILDNTFAGFVGLSKVVLPDSVETIGTSAFENCADLKEINLTNVTTIGNNAFNGCSKLDTIGNLNNITTIGDLGLANTALSSIALPNVNTLSASALIENTKLKTLTIGTGTAEGEITFDFASLLGSGVITLTLGARVTAIDNTIAGADESLLYANSVLSTINFPAEMETINVSAFNRFRLVKTITIATGNANNDYYVQNYALFKAESLIYYPPTIYGDYTVPESVNGVDITTIAADAFISAKFNKLVLQGKITTVNATNVSVLNVVEMSLATLETLYGQSVALSETVTVQGILTALNSKFTAGVIYLINNYNDNNLSESDKAKIDALVADASKRFIKQASATPTYYDAASKLLYTVNDNLATVIWGDPTAESITIPATLGGYTVSHLANNAFEGFVYLKSLTVNAVLANLALVDTFKDCVSLEEISFGEDASITNIDNINYNLFNNTKLYKDNAIIVWAGVPVAYNATFTEVSASDLLGATVIPVNFFKDATNLTEIILPTTLTVIKDNAFNGCTGLTSISLNNVSTVGRYVFSNCTNLTTVDIPKAINGQSESPGKIPVGMFFGCSALTTVNMDNVNGLLGDSNGVSSAFEGCASLEDVSFLSRFSGIIYARAFYGCAAIETIDLSVSTITEIKASAFENCNALSYLVLGNVSVIGNNAFNQSAFALQTVRIRGTGGIFTKGTAISVGVFPSQVTIYIDAGVNSTVASTVLKNYTYLSAEPRVSFEMLTGFSAGNNQLDMQPISTTYIAVAPEVKLKTETDEYEFVDWFIYDNDQETDIKAVFPMTVTANTVLKAKYYSKSQGSITKNDLVELPDGTYSLNSYASTDDKCEIPAIFVDGNKEYIISQINLSAFNGKSVKSLVIPEVLRNNKMVGVKVLTGTLTNPDFEYIKIASTVTTISANNAFANLSKLDIEWAGNSMLTTAFASAFVGTKWYTEAVADASTTGTDKRFVIAGRLAIYYKESAKADDNTIIEIPTQVIKLNDNLFSSKTYPTTITLNDGLQIIGNNCFANASNLATVNYENGVTVSSIIEVSLNAFIGTPWYNNKNDVFIGKVFLEYKGTVYADSYTIPAHITTIAPNAFEEATIKTITFAGNNVAIIGDYAFRGSKLTQITLPSSVTTMGVGVFQNCLDLISADFSVANITALKEDTFNGCGVLKTLNLNEKVTYFETDSLAGCEKLLNITADGLAEISELVLNDIIKTDWYKKVAGEDDLHLILGKVYIKYKIGSRPVLNNDNLVEITIPNGILVIANSAFSDNDKIGIVTIPSSIETIEIQAFKNCINLKEVVIGASNLKVIEEEAFAGTSKLETISLPDCLEEIGNSAFYGSGLRTVIIPNSVKTIGDFAFANSAKLENVILGTGLTYIGGRISTDPVEKGGAFSNNPNLYKVEWALESITIDAQPTIEQFNNINIRSQLAEGGYTLNAEFVDSIFEGASGIRMYIPSAALTVIGGVVPNYVTIWKGRTYFGFYETGNTPNVTFDASGYVIPTISFDPNNADLIISIPTPSKTNHTFMFWQIDGEETEENDPIPMTFPYKVKKDITINAIWYNNIRTSGMTDEILGFAPNASGLDYRITSVAALESVMYVPNTYDGLPVVGFDLTETDGVLQILSNDVKKIIFTQASNFTGIDSNIFRVFPNLEEVVLYDSNMANVNYKVLNGAMYSVDGKELIAYFIQRYTEGENEGDIINNFIIPAGVTTILPYAFKNSGLTSITIPSTVNTIGIKAFSDGMATITFAQGIYLTDATKASFDNTAWYVSNSKQDYVFNNSVVGRFNAAANMLLAYHEVSEPNTLRLPNTVNGFAITVIASEIYESENLSRYPNKLPGEAGYAAMLYNLIVLPSGLRKINANAFIGIDTLNFDGTACVATLNDIADSVFDDTQYYKTTSSGDDLLILGKVLLRYRSTASTLNLRDVPITTIASKAFEASQLVSIVLPTTLTYIADKAFFASDRLQSVAIPDSVRRIGDSAFENCKELTAITFTDNSAMIGIGASAFASCFKLAAIAVPYTVTSIGDNAFNNCPSLTTVTFDKLQKVAGTEEIIVVNKSLLTSLGESAFRSCSELANISIPNGLTEIKANTFTDCVKLVNVTFETDKSKVRTIGYQAFYGCTLLGSRINIDNPNLITIVLPNALVEVKDEAFAYCTGLYGVQFNYNVGTIGNKIFYGCRTLTKIVIYTDNPSTIQGETFDRETTNPSDIPFYNLRIYVKKSVTTDYKTMWAKYNLIIFEMGDLAKLSYRYSAGTENLPPVQVPLNQLKDVYVNPSFTFSNKVVVTNWVFDSVAETTTLAREETTLGATTSEYQRQYNPLTATSDIILVVDCDIMLRNVVS